MEKAFVLLEEVANKKIIVAENIFYPKVSEVEITTRQGAIVSGTITNPEVLKTLVSSFGVTPWVGISPALIVKKTKDGTYGLKIATQVEIAKYPKL